MQKRDVVFLHERIPENPNRDELDVLRQVRYIRQALIRMGYTTSVLPFSLNLEEVARELKRRDPGIVFNLVEALERTGQLLHFAPALLDHLKIPYTGSDAEALFITTNKILAKKYLRWLGIPTCDWYTLDELDRLRPDVTYILKPICEDGSLGIHETCVFTVKTDAFIEDLRRMDKRAFFIETYIDGREFNLSVLGGAKGPQVMPPAEILFTDYPENKPKVVGYAAKWTEDSFEYSHTPRTFRFGKREGRLLEELEILALRCWNEFGLKGYGRVDFRVDTANRPFVLEINCNPCIAPESGFVAAAKRAGVTFSEVVERILEDAFR